MDNHTSNVSRRTLLIGAAALGTGTVLAATPADAWAANANDRAWKWFRSKGLPTFQVAGIMGNFIYESGGTPSNPVMNPRAKQRGGPGRGIAQWESGGPRFAHLVRYAKEKFDMEWYWLRPQLYFVWHELNTDHKHALRALKATKNVEQATYQFMDKYEVPGHPNYEARLYYAKRVLKNRG